MKKLRLFMVGIILSAIAGCMQRSDHPAKPSVRSVTENNALKRVDTICFERYSGLKNQDTASVKMVISGSEVHGFYSYFPYQKDARIGTLAGKKSGNEIKGIWRYMQEGINDSLPFAFRLEGDKLWQKKTSFSVTSGRETLPDSSSFSDLFEKIDCAHTDYRMMRK